MRPSLTPAQLLKLGRSLPAAAPVTPLDVSPLEVPGADLIVPEGFDGGVNIALREAVPGGVPVKVHYTTPRLLDTVEVFWGDELFPAGSLVLETETTSPVGLTVPAHLIEDGIVEAWAKVTEYGGSGEVSTERRRYLVKLTRPGGNDTDAGEPGNQKMIAPILPDDIIQNGVGPVEAENGVPVTIKAWDNMAYHDVCELHWGTQTVGRTVETPDDVGKDMVITVTKDVILAAGDDSTLNVVYKLVDQVNNSSRDSEERPWSPTTYVEVRASSETLDPPWLLAADNLDEELEVVDLDELDGVGLLVQLFINNPSPYHGGQCTMTWHGLTTDGSVVDYTPDKKPVTQGRSLFFDVPNAVAEQIRGGRTVVYYTLSKPELADAHSMRVSFDVIGAPLTWPAPEALDLNADDELPITLADARFRTPVYGGKAAGDRLVLCWSGVSQSGEAVNYESLPHTVTESEKNTPYTLSVPQVQLVPLDGTRATVFYKVNPGTAKERISGYLTVNVGVGSTALKEPRVTQALNGWLNPVDLPLQGAELVVPRGTVIEENDRITYFWVGNATSQKSDSTLAGPSEDIKFDIAAVNITPNTTVEAWYTVMRGSDLKGTSPRLLLNIGVNLALPAPTTEPTFPDGDLDPDQVGATLQVVVENSDELAPGDTIIVHWDGLYRPTSVTESFPPTGDLSVPIDKDPYVIDNANGSVEVWYEAWRGGVLVGNSLHLRLNVLEPGQQPWPAPTVSDANGDIGNTLTPIRPGTTDEENTATVIITDERLQPTDLLAVVWTVSGREPEPIFATLGEGEARAQVPRELIAAALGNQVILQYVVWRGSDVIGTWAELLLSVLPLTTDALSRPNITEANGADVLDVSTLTGDAHATVAAWPFITTTQLYTLEARGTLADGNTTVITLANNQPVSSLAGVSRTVPLAQLRGLLDGSALTLVMKVAFGGDANEMLAFPEHTYTLHTIADIAPQITGVQGASGAVGDGGSTEDTSLTLSGTATAGQSVEVFDGMTSLGTVPADGAGNWAFTAAPLVVGPHVFVAQARYGSGQNSNEWRLSVTVPLPPPLTIDQQAMVLSGLSVKLGYGVVWPLTGQDSLNNTSIRQPQGGVPPYTYRSANTDIATVSGNGKVTGVGNGATTIRVSDSQSTQVTYQVQVSNIWFLYSLINPQTSETAVTSVASVGGLPVTQTTAESDFTRDINRVYIPLNRTERMWAGVATSSTTGLVLLPGSRFTYGSSPKNELYRVAFVKNSRVSNDQRQSELSGEVLSSSDVSQFGPP